MRKIPGKKIGKDGMHPEMATSKGDLVFPTFYIAIEHLPEAKDWKIGETYELKLQLRQTGLNIRRHEGRKEDMGEANFEIVGIEPGAKVKGGKPSRYSKESKGEGAMEKGDD